MKEMQTLRNQAIKEIKNIHILLDNNVLGFFSGEAKSVQLLNTQLQENGCIYVINDLIRFEYLRDSNRKSMALDKIEAVGRIVEMSMTVRTSNAELMNMGVAISNVYAMHGIAKGKNMTDILISAFLSQYGKELILLTKNGKDFPPILHDVIDTVAVSVDRGLKRDTLTLLRFNKDKFNKEIQAYSKKN